MTLSVCVVNNISLLRKKHARFPTCLYNHLHLATETGNCGHSLGLSGSASGSAVPGVSSLFRQVYVPTGLYSDRSIFRQFDIPTGLYSDRSIFRQVNIPTGRYSDRSIIRQVVIPTGRWGRPLMRINCF